MNRVEALRTLFARHPQAFFVFSNGLTSREAAHYLRRPNCFYLLHAMGEALSVGVGLARSRPGLEVVVIDGDGNALMGLASWSLMPVVNLKYYVLDNGVYDTTGGQPLPALPSVPDWCTVLSITAEREPTPNPPPPAVIWRDTCGWLQEYGKE